MCTLHEESHLVSGNSQNSWVCTVYYIMRTEADVSLLPITKVSCRVTFNNLFDRLVGMRCW